MIGFGDVEYRDPDAPFRPEPAGSPMTVEPPEVPAHVDAELRAHVRAALSRVGWPPERPDDYDLETP